VDAALTAALGPGRHVALSADLGPSERYRRFLAVSRGQVRVVAGTRAAVFAPVAELGLVAVFDDGDDLLAEPRAPYPHAREVLMLRSAARSCALLVGGFARTAEAQLLVESGWAQPILGRRADVRSAAPRIEAAGDDFSVGADSAAARARSARPCWSRCPAVGTCRRSPAPGAAGGRNAGTAEGRWPSPVPTGSAAAGAVDRRRSSAVPPVDPTGCGRYRSGPGAPPRKSAEHSPAFR
jgi:hypothetical protein